MIYYMTPDEEVTIEQCCGWLDDKTIAMCLDVAEANAEEILNPTIAEEKLVTLLTQVIVRNRRAVSLP
jgi:hypothetical protein